MIEYQLHERIGKGGMGDVYIGAEKQPNGKLVPVACKILNSAWRRERELIECFQQEAEVNRRISHNHGGLVTLHHWMKAQPGGQDFLIMELIDGCSLADLIHHAHAGQTMSERMPLDMVRLIARAVLDALAYVHECGITHRDISPGNILIAHDGAIKLADLGLARPPSKGEKENRFNGKPTYASPEHLPGQRYDERSDLYSFGTVLYEMLTGAPPFGAKVKFGELLERTSPVDWQAPSLPDDVPEDLRTVTMGLLQGEQAKRHPATAAEAYAAIRVPADVETTRGQLRAIVKVRQQLARQYRQGEEPGSYAGMRVKALHLHVGGLEDSSKNGRTGREIAAGRIARMLGIGLLTVAAIGGLAIGLYGQLGTHAPPAIVAPSAQGNDERETEEAEGAEERRTAENEPRPRITPVAAEEAAPEVSAPVASSTRESARPARTPRRLKRKRASMAASAPMPTLPGTAPKPARLHNGRRIVLKSDR